MQTPETRDSAAPDNSEFRTLKPEARIEEAGGRGFEESRGLVTGSEDPHPSLFICVDP
jgi:hypothetical protein